MKAFSPKSKPETQRADPERKHTTSQAGLSAGSTILRASRIVDSRPEAIEKRQLQALLDQRSQVQRQAQLKVMIDASPRMMVQRKRLERMFGPTMQRQEGLEGEDNRIRTSGDSVSTATAGSLQLRHRASDGLSRSGNVVQRIITAVAGGFASDFVDGVFATQREAELAELDFRTTKQGKGAKRKMRELEKERRPTAYSYVATGAGRTTAPQGPHTVARTYTENNIGRAQLAGRTLTSKSTRADFTTMFGLLSLPVSVTALYNGVKADIPPSNQRAETERRIDLAAAAYAAQHNVAARILNHADYVNDWNDATLEPKLKRYLYDIIRRLIDLHPMATYRWVGTDATQGQLAGKAEGRSEDFHTYVDPDWISDRNLSTVEMNTFITTLHPAFVMANYLQAHGTHAHVNDRLDGTL